MKFKIDENLPVEIAEELRVLGYDALTVVEQDMAGINDERLMAHVEEESRIRIPVSLTTTKRRSRSRSNN